MKSLVKTDKETIRNVNTLAGRLFSPNCMVSV